MAPRHICCMLSLLATAALPGCVKAPERLPPPAHEPAVRFDGTPPASNRRILGGHNFLIMPGDHQPWIQRTSYFLAGRLQREITMTAGETSVRILNDRLLVNGDSYGRLAPSSSVVIDHGVVKVNGVQVEGQPWEKEVELAYLAEEF